VTGPAPDQRSPPVGRDSGGDRDSDRYAVANALDVDSAVSLEKPSHRTSSPSITSGLRPAQPALSTAVSRWLTFPGRLATGTADRQFLVRVVRHLMYCGVRQFSALGVLTMDHIHSIADKTNARHVFLS